MVLYALHRLNFPLKVDLRSASGVNSDVIKMAVTALLIRLLIVYVLKYVSQTKSFIV